MNNRVLIITDSLGCPRTEINVDDTWTYKLLNTWSNKKIVFYTFCKHGLDSEDILHNLLAIREIEPNIIICQFGIVDACRRAMSKKMLTFITKVPIFRKGVRWFCEKNHYMLTKLYEIHYNSADTYKKAVEELLQISKKAVLFVPIIGGGELHKRVYYLMKDINHYNSKVQDIKSSKLKIVNPYLNTDLSKIILDDGHHLTVKGNEEVYKSINKVLEKILYDEEKTRI